MVFQACVSFKDIGYTNVLENISILASDNDSYLSLMRQYLVNDVKKMCLNDLKDKGPLGKLGWMEPKESKAIPITHPIIGNNKCYIDWHRYVVMETLFNSDYFESEIVIFLFLDF